MDDGLMGFSVGIGLLIFSSLVYGLYIPDHHAHQLAEAICLEKYGTEIKHIEFKNELFTYTIEGVVCKEPPKEEDKFDGLTIKIKGDD